MSKVRVLIVDDSAFVRKVVREMLTSDSEIEVVGTARDGHEALEMADRLRPDVVTCDLLMPRMDGTAFVREQMRRHPLPILLLSATSEDGERALEALDAGAVDFLQKPTALATNDLLKIGDELVQTVKGAARTPGGRMRTEAAPARVPEPTPTPIDRRDTPTGKVSIVVLGISTGGPQALRQLLPQLPKDLPVPLAMVLHMPVGYTAMFARKLDEVSHLRVFEATDGAVLEPGTAFLAQAGRHLILNRESPTRVVTRLSIQPIDSLHRPSVDVLFRSAAEAYGSGVLGVVMTGMGNDGREGSAWIKAQGGAVITEAQESCVIYGMPRSVVEAGLSDACVPLDRMAQAIWERL